MTKNILKDEILKDEQLEQVAGGTESETNKDYHFFKALGVKFGFSSNGFNTDNYVIDEAFAKYGVSWTYNLFSNNYYKFGGDQKYPRMAALGYVLAKMNYPGYNGAWWDCPATENFIRNNISSKAV